MRLLSLFHIVVPPLLLWAIWRLGYDPRGWEISNADCVDCDPRQLFLASAIRCQLGTRTVFREQNVVPGIAYLLFYLIAVPCWFIGRRICFCNGGTGETPVLHQRVDANACCVASAALRGRLGVWWHVPSTGRRDPAHLGHALEFRADTSRFFHFALRSETRSCGRLDNRKNRGTNPIMCE